jgi:hypothetical protein
VLKTLFDPLVGIAAEPPAPPAPTVTAIKLPMVIFDSADAPPPEFSPLTLER